MKTLEYYKNLDSDLVQHAIRELNPSKGDSELKLQMLEIVEAFADMGHSGASAPWCASALARLFMFEPLGPLTGEDDEWNEVIDGVFQNKRASNIFRENGECYRIDGRIFSDDGGKSWFTSFKSRTPVEFPYVMAEPERVLVEKEEEEEQ